MDKPLPAPPSPSADARGPSFSSFWKRTKAKAAAAAAAAAASSSSSPSSRQVSFMPGVAHFGRGRGKKGEENVAPGEAARPGQPADDGDGDEAADGTKRTSRETGEATGSSGPETPGGGNQPPRTASEKAQIRRAQVRRAQQQHRQRKAEYVRQLELDVDTLRDLIAAAEQDVRVFQSENDAIRRQLGRSGGGGVSQIGLAQPPADVDGVAASLFSPLSLASEPGRTGADQLPELFADVDVDEVMVSVVLDEAVGNPIFQIASLDLGTTSSSTPLSPDHPTTCATTPAAATESVAASLPASAFDPGFVPSFNTDLALMRTGGPAGEGPPHLVQPPPAIVMPRLTVAETHQVVNFILALEHVCWGHAGHQYYGSNDAAACFDSGHALMATSLLMREAPPAAFAAMQRSATGPGSYTTNTDPGDAEATRRHLAQHQTAQGVAWPAPDLSLQALYGLAASLNPQSALELAPVQAWFELAARYPLSVLLRPPVLDALKRELVGVVRCLHFGAFMERGAFESVVQRVVEPVVEAEAWGWGPAGAKAF